ncbi:MAG: hypothetical protein KBG15_10990 [Kofleriaceae bacterium]|nr:hypothetical protein [Kofleriaceae bacterium]
MSSQTSTNDTSADVAPSDAEDVPKAIAYDAAVPVPLALDPLRWVKRGIYAAVVVIGWVFISWSNRYRFAAPVVILQLGWLAVVSAVYFLWQTGATATAELDGTDPWWRPIGKLEALEGEKRAMLKAIKEVEFDHQMGKQSAADAREIIAVYRARAIEVIKAIDLAQGSGPASVRDQIEREIKARVEVLGKSARAESKAAQAAKRGKKAKAPATEPVAAVSAAVAASVDSQAAVPTSTEGTETEELAP